MIGRDQASMVLPIAECGYREASKACLETTRGAVFGEKAGWLDEEEYPWWIFD